jgi:hypothetical protein
MQGEIVIPIVFLQNLGVKSLGGIEATLFLLVVYSHSNRKYV